MTAASEQGSTVDASGRRGAAFKHFLPCILFNFPIDTHDSESRSEPADGASIG